MDSLLLIIGAGASGLLAAWTAAHEHPDRRILVLERMPEAGAKLARTGGGRGNLSHRATEEEFATQFGRQGRFAIPAFRSFPPQALRTRFEELGIPTTTDPDGRIYPLSQSAVQVRDALVAACVRAGVRFEFNHAVEHLTPPEYPDGCWRADSFSARTVLLAGGGQSAAHLGSNGSSFALAKSLGYALTPPVPALTALHLDDPWVAMHSGLSLPDATLSLVGERKATPRSRGELLFTHRGLSGPAVLNLSGEIARRRESGAKVQLQLCLFQETPDLAHMRNTAGAQSVQAWLARSIPRALASTLLDIARIPPTQTFSRLTAAQGKQLIQTLTALPLTVRRTSGFEESMVTSGGVGLKQVRPDTLEGRLTPRLYFAGELLDLNGPTGGWNLQWAFCSGHLAGRQML